MEIPRQAVISAFSQSSRRAANEGLVPGSLAVEALSSDNVAFAGVDDAGVWVVAVSTRQSSAHPPDLRLQTVRVEYGHTYKLRLGETTQQVRVSVLRCETSDVAIRDLFVTFVVAILSSISSIADEVALSSEVDKWVSLFWRLQTPPLTDVVGLIGELTVLELAPDTASSIRAWHGEPTSNIDFVFADPAVELEVKATRGQARIHHLSMSQASNAENRFFASVQVDMRDSGSTIGDVAHRIANRVAGMAESHTFWRIMAESCGSSLNEFLQERYVVDFSRDSLRFYRAIDIPQPVVGLPLPPGVSSMKFASDFSWTHSVDPEVVYDGSTQR